MKDNMISEKDGALSLSQLDLRKLGLEEVAYIKNYKTQNGLPAWVLHAADGKAVAVQKTEEAACESARQQSLTLVSLH